MKMNVNVVNLRRELTHRQSFGGCEGKPPSPLVLPQSRDMSIWCDACMKPPLEHLTHFICKLL